MIPQTTEKCCCCYHSLLLEGEFSKLLRNWKKFAKKGGKERRHFNLLFKENIAFPALTDRIEIFNFWILYKHAMSGGVKCSFWHMKHFSAFFLRLEMCRKTFGTKSINFPRQKTPGESRRAKQEKCHETSLLAQSKKTIIDFVCKFPRCCCCFRCSCLVRSLWASVYIVQSSNKLLKVTDWMDHCVRGWM